MSTMTFGPLILMVRMDWLLRLLEKNRREMEKKEEGRRKSRVQSRGVKMRGEKEKGEEGEVHFGETMNRVCKFSQGAR